MTKAIFTDSMLLVSKWGVKSLALALTPKETTVLAYFHQMRGANNFLVWIQMQQLNVILYTQPVPKHCSVAIHGDWQP